MIITDYFRSDRDLTWDYALQCGVTHGVVRLPETPDFDPANRSHWRTVVERFRAAGIRPLVVEPLPNALHDHIKLGDALRDECIEKALAMFPIMEKFGFTTLCANFMAAIGWTRTSQDLPDRGGALVTGFDETSFRAPPGTPTIDDDKLWDNLAIFLRAAVPVAERHGIRIAIHPDDPPLPRLGPVARILRSAAAFERAWSLAPSPCLGATFCQATFAMMGEDVYSLVPRWKDKIFFVHFRNARGTASSFRETFHDEGQLDMARLIRLYEDNLPADTPVRVDHVPAMGAADARDGYGATGRLFAIGYLKGLMEKGRKTSAGLTKEVR
ncbi:MAG: mannonate dehydratase [Kiritimatiellae bacterium]|nr:mannonate dehydratase [Kiritimatiellia bacterium]